MDFSFDRRCRRDFGSGLFDFGADIRLGLIIGLGSGLWLTLNKFVPAIIQILSSIKLVTTK
jgi:hypothetical protein